MTRRRLSVALVVVVLLVSGVAWAQPPKPAVATPPVKALPTAPAKPVAPPRAKSPCPDGAFQQACDSYAELVKAKDDDVSHITTMSTLDIHLVCFRGTEDSFFVLNMTSIGWNKRHFDPSTKTIVGDDDATQPLVDGHVKSFVKGIQVLLPGDKPVLFGYWRHPHNPVFESKFDGQYFEVTFRQITASTRYQNSSEADVDYDLLIQRSTGRFSERYTLVTPQTLLSETHGRCAVPPLS